MAAKATSRRSASYAPARKAICKIERRRRLVRWQDLDSKGRRKFAFDDGRKSDVTPIRFVCACEKGHLQDRETPPPGALARPRQQGPAQVCVRRWPQKRRHADPLRMRLRERPSAGY